MNKVQLIAAALAVGATSIAFADDMMPTTSAPVTDTMQTCVAQMNKADCDAAQGTMSTPATSDTAVQDCMFKATQSECDAKHGKIDNTMMMNNSTDNTSMPDTTAPADNTTAPATTQ